MDNYEFLSHVVVHRSHEATCFEVVCGLLTAVMWVLSLVLGSGSVAEMAVNIIVNVLLTFIVVGLLWSAYHPSLFNLPVRISNGAQVATAIRLLHVLTLQFCVYFAVMPLLVNSGVGDVGVLLETVILLSVIIWTIIYYCAKIKKQDRLQRKRKTA